MTDGRVNNGGSRGGGRPAIGDSRHNVTLPTDTNTQLRELGGGSLSAGIVAAAAAFAAPPAVFARPLDGGGWTDFSNLPAPGLLPLYAPPVRVKP